MTKPKPPKMMDKPLADQETLANEKPLTSEKSPIDEKPLVDEKALGDEKSELESRARSANLVRLGDSGRPDLRGRMTSAENYVSSLVTPLSRKTGSFAWPS